VGLKSKILAAGAVLALAGGLGTIGATASSAATPSCGPGFPSVPTGCINIFSKQFGTFGHPAFVLDVMRQGAKVGQPIILFRTSNSDPAEDFVVSSEGSVSDFYAAGLVSSSLALHYGCGLNINTGNCSTAVNPVTGKPWPDDYAFELEYAPFGVDSGLCVGLASTAVAGEKVTLQGCGVSSKTTWIADTVDSCPSNPLYFAEVPAINGSSTNFSHPHVLTYPGGGFPTDMPRQQLFVNNLTGFSQNGGPGQCGTGSVNGPNSNMLWSAVGGVLP
jgi:hypothetical protein